MMSKYSLYFDIVSGYTRGGRSKEKGGERTKQHKVVEGGKYKHNLVLQTQ